MVRHLDGLTTKFALLTVLLLTIACQPIAPPAPMDADTTAAGSDTAPNAIAFEAVDVACPDGNIVLSDSPFLAGPSQIEVVREPDAVHFSVNATYLPAAYPDASWIAPGQGVDTADGGFFVYHSGDGAGKFAGSRIAFVVTPAELEELPCEPVGPVVKLEGVILSETLAQMPEAEDNAIVATEFTDLDVVCPVGGITITEEQLSAGSSQIEIIREPGEPFFTVNVIQYPTAYPDATWVAPGQGVDTPDEGFVVIHRGVGTGTLEGGEMFYIVHPAQDLSDLPCEPVGPVVDRAGVIIPPSN